MTDRASPAGPTDRAEAMARRLLRTAARLGVDQEGRGRVLQAFRVAMEPRRRGIADDHHPDYLHPARTALILMDDAREADPHVLVLALVTETRDPSLAPSSATLDRLSGGLAAHLARIPGPGDGGDPLLERLLALSPAEARVAAAERLDHARHLHLRDREEWVEYHATTRDAYAPVAMRTDEALGGRLQAWCATFRRRFLDV